MSPPGYFWSWPRWGRRRPAWTRRSPELVCSSTPPRRTCPGSDTAGPSCSAAWPHLGGTSPTPGDKVTHMCSIIITWRRQKTKTELLFPFRVASFTFSLISSALLQSGSASLYLPLFPYRTARLLRVAATAGWSFPRVFSLMASASFRRWAASLYLFWSLAAQTQRQRFV